MALNNVLVYPDPVQSIKVDLTETVEANQAYTLHGFHGVVMEDGDSGDSVVMDISSRTWQLTLTGVTAEKGTKLYITSAGVLTETAGGNRWFGILVTDMDDNDVADVWIAPQS